MLKIRSRMPATNSLESKITTLITKSSNKLGFSLLLSNPKEAKLKATKKYQERSRINPKFNYRVFPIIWTRRQAWIQNFQTSVKTLSKEISGMLVQIHRNWAWIKQFSPKHKHPVTNKESQLFLFWKARINSTSRMPLRRKMTCTLRGTWTNKTWITITVFPIESMKESTR